MRNVVGATPEEILLTSGIAANATATIRNVGQSNVYLSFGASAASDLTEGYEEVVLPSQAVTVTGVPKVWAWTRQAEEIVTINATVIA